MKLTQKLEVRFRVFVSASSLPYMQSRIIQSSAKLLSHAKRLRPAMQVGEIERCSLNLEHAQNIAPLPIRHTAAHVVPFQLRQNHVFRRFEIEKALAFCFGQSLLLYPADVSHYR